MADFTPQYTKRNILTGQAALYLQPMDFDDPAVLPDDDEPLGFDWVSPWEAAGATMEGVTVTFAREATDIRIEEQSTPVDQKTASAGFTVALSFSEDTLATMRYAYGGGTITTIAAGVGTPGKQRLVISEDIEHFALGFEGQARPRTGIATPWRRVLLPDVTSTGDVETPYRRADGQRVYPATFTSLSAVKDIVIEELNALPTA